MSIWNTPAFDLNKKEWPTTWWRDAVRAKELAPLQLARFLQKRRWRSFPSFRESIRWFGVNRFLNASSSSSIVELLIFSNVFLANRQKLGSHLLRGYSILWWRLPNHDFQRELLLNYEIYDVSCWSLTVSHEQLEGMKRMATSMITRRSNNVSYISG